MNLSNEKNKLLSSVSSRAAALSAQPLLRVVTRGAMMGVALTAFYNFSMGSNSALAACVDGTGGDAVAGAINEAVACGVGAGSTADGYDTNGWDGAFITVGPDGIASGKTGDGIDVDGSNKTTIVILDTDFDKNSKSAGVVSGNFGDGIEIDGDDNTVNNGGSTTIGGGLITSAKDDGIDIDGAGNTVNNASNGKGGTGVSGVISGAGLGDGDDGIVLAGGTSGKQNVVNNGTGGTATAYIISGGPTGNVTGDDGIQTSGWSTINNGTKGVINGQDRGIEFVGTASGETLTVKNDGTITGDVEDGILVAGKDGVIVNYSGDGTVKGGSFAAGIDIAPNMDDAKVTVTFGPGTTGVVTGGANGIELGDDEGGGIPSNNNTVTITGKGVVSGTASDADGIHVYDGTGNTFNVKNGAKVEGKDDGIFLGSGNTVLVDNAIVQGDTDGTGGGDGIQGDDNNTITLANNAKVNGDPGILVDDGNKIKVDGGSEVNADPGDGINVDDNNEITIGGASAGYVKATNGGDGIDLGSDVDGGGGSTDNNKIDIGNGGQVLVSGTGNGNGVVIGNVDEDNEDNSLVIKSGGLIKVTNADGHGVVVNAQDEEADDNTVTIQQGGTIEASGDGVRLLGDDVITSALGATIGNDDGVGNDLKNEGVIRATHNGVLVSNTNSDVDNSGGEIYAGGDGVRFTTLHTDELDNDGGKASESGYQSDENSVIVAGRDGIHYDNADEEGGNADANHVKSTKGDVNGLGEIDNPLDLLFGITGYIPEVVENAGIIEANRHGIRVNDDFDVTNLASGVIVAGGLPGKTGGGGDGIHADANNTITNYGTIAAGLNATKDTHGVEVVGESNTIVNNGLIDTRGDTNIALINNNTLEYGTGGLQDNGKGGDGIHAGVNGLTLAGMIKNGYDQQEIINNNIIIAADDGIDAKSGLGIPGGEQIITNDEDAEIHADDDGIVAEHYNIITNDGDISSDEDNKDGGDGINVGHSNVVTNTGDIKTGTTGNGIVMAGEQGPFSFGNKVTNSGNIKAGLDGIQVNGEENYIENTGGIKGGVNGVALNDEENDFVSTAGLIEGGTGAGIYSDNNNHIELSGTTDVTTTVGKAGNGIVLGDDNVLEIEDGVSVTGDKHGLVLEGDDNDVDIEGDNLTNNGSFDILGRDGDGIQITGDSNTINTTKSVDVGGGDDGIDINGGNSNAVDIDGDVTGEDDGIVITNGTSNNITVGGDVIGDYASGGGVGGDGVDISGGASNVVKVTGDIIGDPGVVITNSSNNNVSGATIQGTDGGVIISNGSNNTVASTVGGIKGDSDGDNDGDGVGINGTGNIVTSAADISGADAVDITGSTNNVKATTGIVGVWDGVSISGTNNVVSAGTFITGTKAEGVEISGSNNNVSAGGAITGDDDAVAITGNNNEVKSASITSNDADGVDIDGNSNLIDTGNITGADSGVEITGDSNNIDAAAIDGNGDEGVGIDGDSNTVTATTIEGYWDGADIEGNNNSVTATTSITGQNGQGVDIFGLGNNVLVKNGGITGGSDGVYVNGLQNNVVAFGTIEGKDGNGVGIDGHNNGVSTTKGGSIIGSDNGAYIGGNNNSVSSDNDITGKGEHGVYIDGNTNTVDVEDDISGAIDGVRIEGSNNTLTSDAVTGTTGDGISITGSSNNLTTGSVVGGDDGIAISGANNFVKVTGDVTGDGPGNNNGVGDGVDITGASNTVGVSGTISGDPGVVILGNLNVVTGGNIVGQLGGAKITGNQNAVTSLDDITTVNGPAVGIIGNQNTVIAIDAIDSDNGDGVNITGNQNIVNAAKVYAGKDGIEINGNQNAVDVSTSIEAIDNGVWFNSGTGNNVDLTNVKIDAGQDGVLVDEKGNTFQHNASTIINAGDDGIEYEYGGIANAYESLIWLGKINAKDDGIVADSGFFSIINNGTINADTDKTGGGDGIVVTDNNTVQNNGTITGDNGIVGKNDNSVTNSLGATITATTDGIIVGNKNIVKNDGTITAGDDGIEVGNGNTVTNSGNLSIHAKDDGIVAGDDNTITNTGWIEADSDKNKVGDGIDASDKNTITNASGAKINGWNGIVVDGAGGENIVTNAKGGTIDVTNNGINANANNTVTNDGSILADNIGVNATTTNQVTNTGTITADVTGVVFNTDNTLDNAAGGVITGGTDGVLLSEDDNTVNNSGQITGTNDDGVQIGPSGTTASGNIVNNNAGGIVGKDDGVEISGNTNTVNNDSTITGTNGDGVAVLAGSGNTVNNYDTLSGGEDGVDIDSADNNVFNDNNAVITGKGGDGIEMSGGSQNVWNEGKIEGKAGNGINASGDGDLVQNWGTILGSSTGASFTGNSNALYNYTGNVTGTNANGVTLTGNNNLIVNDASILGKDEGIEIIGNGNAIWNGDDSDDAASIVGTTGDGIDIDGPGTGEDAANQDNAVYNWGSITGLWSGIDNSGVDLAVTNVGGTITGQNSDGITSNLGGSRYTAVYNSSQNVGLVTLDRGIIIGDDNGINAGGDGLRVENNAEGLIRGVDDDGIYTSARDNVILNAGEIRGAHTGITDGQSDYFGGDSTYILNSGLITGSEAGYLYEGASYAGDIVQIDNTGIIEATGEGQLPVVGEDSEDVAVDLDLINGEDADPVAAIDTSAGGPNLQVFIYNWGQINGANEFTPPVADLPETEEDETDAGGVLLTNRFAILGGAGEEYVANFAGGVINGDIALQGNSDVLALEIGSTLNGDADLGTDAFDGEDVLTVSVDNPETEEDEAGVGFAPANDVDTSVDTVILFGQGVQDLNGDITEAEILYVNDQLTQADLYKNHVVSASVPGFPTQPVPLGTWNLNGNVTIDGTNLWNEIKVDGDGDGVLDEETTSGDETLLLVNGTVGTVVDNGRLNVGGTILVEIPGEDSDEEEGDGSTFVYEVQSKAVLTSPVVDVLSGGTLGGHGTIVTNPGANGGNGGVNLDGTVYGDRTVIGGVNEANLHYQFIKGENRGGLLDDTLVPGNLITQGEDGKTTANVPDGEDENDYKLVTDDKGNVTKVDILYVVDSAGNYYPGFTLPVGFVEEKFAGSFDLTTQSPRYATIAPGDEIIRVGKLDVVGNVTFDKQVIETTQYKVAVQDNPATKEVDESKDSKGNQIYQDVKGRDVVTNWGSQGQFDLRDDGKGDLLNVIKSGVTSAIVGEAIDLTGPGTVDLVTQNADGTAVPDKTGDGIADFDIKVEGETKTKVNRIVAGAGGPDGVPDSIAYSVKDVPDGEVFLAGRLDIRLDGEFVDLVDNSQLPTIPDPENTGCGDDPDGADSCPQIPNPLYNIPDGLPDVDAKGIAKNNADYSKDAKVWDIIIAKGGTTADPTVHGKFDEKGFDGGPNDGAVIVRADDPTTAEDEELRVQLLKAYLQYLPDRVRIISIPAFGPKGTTINQIATGEYIDSLTKYGLNEDALHAILALVGTATDIPGALDALHPEWYNAFNEVGFSIARGAEQQAYIRTIEAQGFASGQQNRVVMNVGDDSAVGSSASDRRATFWLAGSWGNASIDDGGDEGWLEYKYETLTGYAGFDYLINPNFLLGILGGFSNSDVDARNASGNEGDVDSWQVGGYVSYFTDSWFLNAGGGIGDMNIESIRNIQFGSGIGNISQVATADYDGDITYFYGKGGYSFDLGNSGWKLSPELALSYAKVKQDGFSESGTGNAPGILLNVDAQSVESLRGTAQLRLSKTFLAGNGGGWMPYVRVGVANEFEDELRPITSGFQSPLAGGSQFTVFGKVPRETTVIFGAGVSGKVSEMFSVYLDYSGEIGGSFSEHVISGGVRLHF